jgi:medium-chain acyl-[acyl-carrier-protein] hydrolase
MSRPRWLTKVAGGPGAALICVPHAGAGSLAYRTWAPHLAEGMGLMIAVLPGRDRRMREPPAIRAAEVIEPLGAAIAAEHQPHVLFGHSMGALVAFGVTQWLRDNGFPGPLALVVSGSPAPSAMPRADFHRMGDDAFVAMVRSLGGTPEELFAHPGMRARMLSLLRADFALAHSNRRRARCRARSSRCTRHTIAGCRRTPYANGKTTRRPISDSRSWPETISRR